MKKLSNLIAMSALVIAMFQSMQVIAQSTVFGNASSGSTEFLGWSSGSSKDLNVINQFTNRQINFLTNGGIGAVPRMSIFNTGEVKIGNATTAPASLLDVDGDANLNDPGFSGLTKAYKLRGFMF